MSLEADIVRGALDRLPRSRIRIVITATGGADDNGRGLGH